MALAAIAAALSTSTPAQGVQRIAVGCAHTTAPRLCSIRAHWRHSNALRTALGIPRVALHLEHWRYPTLRDRMLSAYTRVHRELLLRYLGVRVAPLTRAGDPAAIIRRVFGTAAPAAISVARCESGLRPTATNGQYHGLFQLSESWRGYFGIGEGYDAQQNTHAAYVIWKAQGWQPWSCQP